MEIVFETHATSLDNEAGLASGRFDVDLSARGEQQAEELGARRRADNLEAVYASDLRRAWRTAELAFGATRVALVRDARLAECDYGTMTRQPATAIAASRALYVGAPYPGGESYTEAAARVASWLADVRGHHRGRVLVIGHRATHFALEHLLRGIPLADAVRTPLIWQPGWLYVVGAR